MPGLPITITDAGRAALINAQNTGTVALTISQVGVSPTHTAGSLTGLAALPGELKRLNTFAGDVVANDTLHLTIRDESPDTFSLRAFALYLSNGVLFAVYSQAAPILEKSAAAMLLLSTDIILASLTTAMIEFGDTDFINPPATTDTPGVVELADQDETNAGVDLTKAVTPGRLKVLLTALLGGKAAAVHTHDAGDVNSGVFSALRIPDLAMARITGLVAALAGKSDTGHTHAAADITSGTFNVLRIPDLAISKITDLAVTLGGKAALVHTHVMADITDLAAALAGKAAAVHTHAMADITGLVAALATKVAAADFTWANLSNKPNVAIQGSDASFGGLYCATLILSPATSAVIALDGTNFAGAQRFQLRQGIAGVSNGGFSIRDDTSGANRLEIGSTGIVNAPAGLTRGGNAVWDAGNFNPTTKATRRATESFAGLTVINGPGEGTTGRIEISPGGSNYSGYLSFYSAAGIRWGYIGLADDTNKVINFVAENGGSFAFGARPTFAGQTPWDSGNFSPAGIMRTDVAQTITHNHAYKVSVTGNFAAVAWNNAALTVQAFDSASAAVMSFLIPGYDAYKVGYDNNGQFKFSESGADRRPWHDGNFNPTPATAAQFRANSSSQPLNPTGVWSAATPVAAAQAATIAIDLAAGLNFGTIMTGNRTLGAPANAKPGQSGFIEFLQDGTGNRTLAFDPAWKFEGGVDPVLSTAPNARDILVFTVIRPDDVVASLLKDAR